MRSFSGRSRLAVLGLFLLGATGCAEDNEAAIKLQASRAKGAIPGSRSAQAQTQTDYYEITPGVRGAGTRSGPIPDQGTGYPRPNSVPGSTEIWRMAQPRAAQGKAPGEVKR